MIAPVASVLVSQRAPRVPLVSVVITTRNHERYLDAAVSAVLAQDLDREFELIVCDNRSDDGTAELMRRLVASADRPVTYVRLSRDLGPAGGRNAGVERATAEFVAFTDSDCVPRHDWLRAALERFADPSVGVVQGRVMPERDRVPLFEHHIAIDRFDGSFATANVVYRRAALAGLTFDPTCSYWEDVDLGWRVVARGWKAEFAPDAVVAHRVVPLSPRRWVLWPLHYATLPAITRRHPRYREHLFLRAWARPIHLWLELALVGVCLTPWQPLAIAMAVPYVVAFARSRGLRGRFPPAKALAYLTRDLVAVIALVSSSARHGRLVL